MTLSPPGRALAAEVAASLGADMRQRLNGGLSRGEAVAHLQRDLDFLLAGNTEAMAAAACRAGCTHCCHSVPSAHPEEVTQIARHIARLPRKQRRRLERRVDKAALRIDAAGPEMLTTLRLRCPLLDDDGRCGVYPMRPIVCRGTSSTDAEACRRFRVLETETVPQVSLFAIVESAATATVVNGLYGGEPKMLPLAVGLAASLGENELPDDCAR